MGKEKFFYDHLSRVPESVLCRMGYLKLFFWLDDLYHCTDFSKRVLRHDHSLMDDMGDTEEEWSCEHSSFYDECVLEIQYAYEDVCKQIKKKYNLVLS